ncbi:uncharacterized protein LOC133180124 [Saccostrea echinata]|uniref:uncharacterized protein LOC133180124 n=1 Tax=Saccostrea echinata TaxID=191078 RepID=UPI002A835415|nr:uncharacterized protein LOC133180124 [Saccostrea echinata]
MISFLIEVLSRGKNATQSTVRSCISSTSCDPDKAVDGDRNTCMKTKEIGQSSPYKTVWWTVDLGANYSIYSISIDFKDYKEYGDYEMRQRGRFGGFSLYLSYTPNIKGDVLCYKNMLPLPPLEFNTTCIGYGRYVIYYNERLDGVTYPEGYQTLNLYTELCEVTNVRMEPMVLNVFITAVTTALITPSVIRRMDFVNWVVKSDILEISATMSVRKGIMVKTVLTFVQQNAVIHVTVYREPALKMKRQQDNGN